MDDAAPEHAEHTQDTEHPGHTEDFDVVLLVEQALTDADARQVLSLHEGLDVQVTYHVLLPVDDAAAHVEAALGNVSGADLVPGPPAVTAEEVLELAQDARDRATDDVAASVAVLQAAGGVAQGRTVTGDPIEALATTVREVDGQEVLVLTRPHVVAEFFHVDWASSARRHLGVPVLHLLERETFDEQAGGGEGVTGL